MNDLFSIREEEIFKAIKWLKDYEFVLIGGYAVNAYTLPRFSVDCDIVLRDETELRKIEKNLLGIGYKKVNLPKEPQYSGCFSRYEKMLENDLEVSIDVLIKNIADRMTGVVFLADWIFKNSKLGILRGKTISEETKLRIITIDALIVMKMISCRPTDIRDIFMMLPNALNKKWITSEISLRYDFNDRISKIIEKVDSKQFRDGLSGVYGKFDQKVFEKHRKMLLTLQKSV